MDTHSPHLQAHESGTTFSFWNLVSMILGTVFGVSTLFLGIIFLMGAMAVPDEKSGASPAAGPSAGGASSASLTPGTPSMVNGVATILIKPGAVNPMSYDTPAFTVKSGKPVKITFSNDSAVPLQHNLCICKPGSKDAMMAESLKIMADPQGLAKGFIPDTPLILWHTRLLNPKESQTLEFTAPAPGDYPYLCTFPGHAAIMNGVMTVN